MIELLFFIQIFSYAKRLRISINYKFEARLRHQVMLNTFYTLMYQHMQQAALTGKDLLKIGYPQTKAIGIALEVMEEAFAGKNKDEKIAILQSILATPKLYLDHPKLKPIAEAVSEKSDTISLLPQKEFEVYGASAIEEGALKQMQTAMKLPITLAGALMPDAHPGYGLPIGGVLATYNTMQ